MANEKITNNESAVTKEDLVVLATVLCARTEAYVKYMRKNGLDIDEKLVQFIQECCYETAELMEP
jgi:hypothetical protein